MNSRAAMISPGGTAKLTLASDSEFKSKSVKKADDGKFEITGDLTLLDKTKEITVTFEKTGDNAGKTSFQIKRSDYGMKYRVPDTADEVDITLDIVAAAAK